MEKIRNQKKMGSTDTSAQAQSQTVLILNALQKGRKLTPLDALHDFGCFRLCARIWDIKRMGYEVNKQMINVANNRRVAQYSIAK